MAFRLLRCAGSPACGNRLAWRHVVAVEKQRVEIGIRMALGAQRDDVITLTVRHTLIMTMCGVAAGLVVAAALTRYLQTLLFGIEIIGSATFSRSRRLRSGLHACYCRPSSDSIDPIVAPRASRSTESPSGDRTDIRVARCYTRSHLRCSSAVRLLGSTASCPR